MDRVHFPVPIVITAPTMKPKDKMEDKEETKTVATPIQSDITAYDNPHVKRYAEYAKIRAACAQHGFMRGSIVVKRQIAKSLLNVPMNWGVVLEYNMYEKDPAMYKPLKIRWFNHGHPDTAEDMTSLYLLHASIPDADLRLMIAAQEHEMQDDDLNEDFGTCVC